MTPVKIDKAGLPASDLLGFDALRVPANRACGGAAWYDVLPLSEARFAVTIGYVGAGESDVATLKCALRASFASHALPVGCAALLSAAEAVLRRHTGCAAAVTALVGVLDCAERTFTYVSSGHPPPYVRYHDGRVTALPALGAPLGRVRTDYPPGQVEVDLRGAALLVLCSGPPVETGSEGGDASLRRVLADERMAHCYGPAAWIASRIFDPLAPDGAALLTVTLPPDRGVPRTPVGEPPNWKVSWSLEATAAVATGARRAFLACLTSKDSGGKAVDLTAAELIFGELLGNVVRHAPGPVDISLDWTGDLPVLHVLDSGPGFRSRRKRERLPVDDLSESGRGLFIVNACAPQFSVRNRNGGGTHATATLPAA